MTNKSNSEPAVDVYALIQEYRSIGYTVEERLAVAMRYVTCGNLKQVSRETGISYDTLKVWKNKTEWWDPVIQECRRQKQDELDGTLTGIIDNALEGIVDRIENGDSRYDAKSGKTVKVPMSGKELSWVAGILFDKRAALRGDPISHNRNNTGAEQLQKLEQRFKEFADKMDQSGILAKPVSGESDGDQEDPQESY